MSKFTRDFPSDQLRVRYNLDSKKLDPPPPPPYDPVYDADPKRWGYFEPIGGPGNNATTLDFDWGCSEYNIVIDESTQEPRVARGNDIRHHRVFLLNDDYNRLKGIQFLSPGEDIGDAKTWMGVEDGFRVTLGTRDFILRHTYLSRPRPEGAFEKYVQVGNESTSGSFGTVITVTDREPPETEAKVYAVKIIRLGTTPRFEVSAMCTLKQCPNVCRMETYFLCSNNTIHILLEHAPDGNLSQYLSSRERFCTLNENLTAWEIFAAIMNQLCTAVLYIQSEVIMHRDIKPNNILVVLHSGPLGFLIKLADFGLAYTTHPRAAKEDCIPHGHLAYTAPELVNGRDHGDAVDAYSAGVIFHQMIRLVCQGKTGASDVKLDSIDKKVAMFRLLKERQANRLWNPPQDFGTVVQQARELVEGLLKENPTERLSMVDALENTWLQETTERIANSVQDSEDRRHQACNLAQDPPNSPVNVELPLPKAEFTVRRSRRLQELRARPIQRRA